MEERTEYDQEITCQHSYDKRCAKSLVTVYNSQQEEECEENYVKNCFIEYSKFAANVTNKVCRTPLVKVSKLYLCFLSNLSLDTNRIILFLLYMYNNFI